MSFFSGVAADFVKGFEAVKNALTKAANEAPGILQKIEGVEPEVTALASLVFPGAGAVVEAANSLLEDVASAVESGGAAAEQNFLNAGVDQATITKVKAVVSTLKSLKK